MLEPQRFETTINLPSDEGQNSKAVNSLSSEPGWPDQTDSFQPKYKLKPAQFNKKNPSQIIALPDTHVKP